MHPYPLWTIFHKCMRRVATKQERSVTTVEVERLLLSVLVDSLNMQASKDMAWTASMMQKLPLALLT